MPSTPSGRPRGVKISEYKTFIDLACIGVFDRNYPEMCSGELVDELHKRRDILGDCGDVTLVGGNVTLVGGDGTHDRGDCSG